MHHGFQVDAELYVFIHQVLEAIAIQDTVEKTAKLDSLLPFKDVNSPHPLYWICLMFFENLGLVERDDREQGLNNCYLTESGFYVLQGLRDRKELFQ